MMRLLIADDSDVLRSRLVDMLGELEGIQVVGEARDCPGALEAINALSPDAVILDIRMPGAGGIFVLETIKNLKKKCPLIIVFTNYPYLQYRKRCLDAGADFFFYKAVELENLLELIRSLSRSSY